MSPLSELAPIDQPSHLIGGDKGVGDGFAECRLTEMTTVSGGQDEVLRG